jgi:4-amino-4-deoxy-L-arabinose transferase-like glycosyltransferase
MPDALAPSLARSVLRRPLLCAAIFAVVAAFAGIHAHSLWSPDEPREAQMSREMLDSGFSAMPTLSREPFLEKPPLFFWMAAASYRLFGVSETAERLPAALCAALAILFAYSIARHASGRRAALAAALFAASFSTFWSVGHRGINDVVLGAAVAGGHALLVRARSMAERGQGLLCALGAGFACGVAFMAKGLIGPALIAGPATLAWLALRDWTVMRRVFPWLALFSGLFVAAFGVPWAFALANHPGGWGNVYACTLGQVIGRVVGDSSVGPHSHPVWYYFVGGWGSLLPWVSLLPAILAVPAARRRLARRPLLDAGLFFLAGVLLLSIPSGKRISYLYPLLPVAAAVPADWIARLRPRDRFGTSWLRFVVALGALGGGALAGLAFTLAAGHPVARKLAPLAAAGRAAIAITAAVALLLLALWCLRLFARLGSPLRARSAVREFLAFVAVGLVASHAIGRPLLEPMNALHPAIRKIVAAIPAGEPVVAFNASETLRAMVPFYGHRDLVRIKTADVLGEMKSLGARHLLVMNDSDIRLPPAVAAKLRPVATTRDDEGFDTTVYEVAE